MDDNCETILRGIENINKTQTQYDIKFVTGETAMLIFLNDHVFRYYMSPSGKYLKYPKPVNPEDNAKIIVKDVEEYGCESHIMSQLDEVNTHYIIKTADVLIVFDKISGTMKINDTRTDKDVLIENEPLSYNNSQCTQTLLQRKDEYYFGGGMQNGRCGHKGNIIHIKNTNVWVDDGVSSPCPFYWSSYGYGILRNTWQAGIYDFGVKSEEVVKSTHNGEDFDAYFFINSQPQDILKDYYELTGRPILMPEYAYYEAHLNEFNQNYWVEASGNIQGAILFEDGKYYKKYKSEDLGTKKGILESLNGENNNYQFSARAMIDRYKKYDMPLGWFIPNDGYGSGYGQSNSLDGDLQNLKDFVDYSRQNGVEVGLWTESHLHPADPSNPKKGERDLCKEVGMCDVVALKCDVAWIGDGYSYGLSAIEDAAKIFVTETKSTIRPLIVTVDGWAGTQRHAGIWSGDQKGGQWEYIRFHIPSYIGTGLSGQPIVGSDMDGIYEGGNKKVNIRDYQWKTFTPLQLNMDGWGNIPKTPFSFDDEATQINRAYLKLKSMLLPYNYTIGHEATNGLPMLRAMFLHYPTEESAYAINSEYQYMWGPYILVSPIYNDVSLEENSIRNGIYLPDSNQIWIDFFTGEKYQGGKIYNNIITPLWKLPVFIKDGGIIPMTNPNNNPNEIRRDNRIFTLYPNGKTSINVYEDDGISLEYMEGHFAITNISIHGPKSNNDGNLVIIIHKTLGSYEKMVKDRSTLLQIMATRNTDCINAVVNGEPIEIHKSKSRTEFESMRQTYYFDEEFFINSYLPKNEDMKQSFLLIKIDTLDVTCNEIIIYLSDFVNFDEVIGNTLLLHDNTLNNILTPPSNFESIVTSNKLTQTIGLNWKPLDNVEYYEIQKDKEIFTNVKGNSFDFKNLKFNMKYNFRIRSVLKDFHSDWSKTIQVVTSDDPFGNIILGVKKTYNILSQPFQEITEIADKNIKSPWHTDWRVKGQAKPKESKYLKLMYDLGAVYELGTIYLPSEDAGNGTLLKIQFRHSIDKKQWTDIETITFSPDNTAKMIFLDGKRIRFIELTLLNTVGDFGSKNEILFMKKPKLDL